MFDSLVFHLEVFSVNFIALEENQVIVINVNLEVFSLELGEGGLFGGQQLSFVLVL